jgi:putative membrane protein
MRNQISVVTLAACITSAAVCSIALAQPQNTQSGPHPGMSAGPSEPGPSGMTATDGGADSQVGRILDQIKSAPESAPDKLFVLGAAMGNEWEVAFSQLVSERAQDQEVKGLARMIQQDHSAAQQQLQDVARGLQLELPQGLPSEKAKKLEIFRSMSPQELQTCFIVDLKADHAKDISSYADHQKTLKNEAVKRYIAQTLPKLREHGAHVQQVASAKQIGDASSGMLGSPDQQQAREMDRARGANGTDPVGGTGVDASDGAGAGTGASTGGAGSSGSGARAGDKPTPPNEPGASEPATGVPPTPR